MENEEFGMRNVMISDLGLQIADFDWAVDAPQAKAWATGNRGM